MQIPSTIDPSRHPLILGAPPDWASEWGQDEYGVFIAFTLEEVTQRLRWIPPGRFLMGSPETETSGLARKDVENEWFEREHPRHPVLITEGFWLFDTPCTQALWETVMGDNPSYFKSPQRPVEQVSWEDVQVFIERLNAKISGLDLMLPSEAQWEYACRAGTDTALYSGPIEILGQNNAPALDAIAWYGGNSGQNFDLAEAYDSSSWLEMLYTNRQSGTSAVGRKQPNRWGLHDMLGNVWEWCSDGLRTYSDGVQIDPHGLMETGAARVVRGGSWNGHARSCRCACRGYGAPDYRYNDLGFRCTQVQA